MKKATRDMVGAAAYVTARLLAPDSLKGRCPMCGAQRADAPTPSRGKPKEVTIDVPRSEYSVA